MKLTPALLTVAIAVVIVVWVAGLIPWWLAVPLLMIIGAVSLAGLAGVLRGPPASTDDN